MAHNEIVICDRRRRKNVRRTLEVLECYAKVFDMKKSTLLLFAESLENEKLEKNKKQRVAFAGMKLLKILEKVGDLEDE